MITDKQFSDGIQKNVNRITHYEPGCDGSENGGCDCIGLIIGAIRLEGSKWPWTHGTNYTVRNRMQNFREIASAQELSLHDLVFKGRKPGENGYSLPSQYKSSGDLTDYYHVGVVTNLNPLRIVHCTSVPGGVQIDTALGKWKYAGWLDQINKDEPEKDNGGNRRMGQYKVTGGKLMLRKGPGTKNQVLKIMENGSVVTAMDDEKDGWMYVDYDGILGYCMAKYLVPCDNYDDDSIGAAIAVQIAEIRSMLDELEDMIQNAL